MKINKVLLLIVLITTFSLTGCITKPDIQEIKEIPENALEIMTSELLGESGTYTKGSIHVSGNGYIILDIHIDSGSVKSVEIKETAGNETIYVISKPTSALYDSAFYEYQVNNEYKLNFTDAKDLHGFITVYFVEE